MAGYKPIAPVYIGVNRDTLNDFATKYNLEIEQVYDILNKHKQRKVVFTANSTAWDTSEGIAKFSVAHNNNIVYAVYKSSDGVDTLITDGISMDGSRLVITADEPFTGYMLLLSDDSSRGVGDNILADVIDELDAFVGKLKGYAEIFEKGFPYATPEMYGAVGDGVANDMAAVQRALSENPGGIIICNKTYKLEPTETLQSLSVANGTTLCGKGSFETYCDTVFYEQLRFVNISDLTFNSHKDGSVLFRYLYHCDIDGIRTYNYGSFANTISNVTNISKCTIMYLKEKLATSITDSVVFGCLITASKLSVNGTSIMIRQLNNSSFAHNYIDFWWTVFRGETGNKTSKIIGNIFTDCVSVFRDWVMGVTIVGNTFANIQYIAKDWEAAPPSPEIQEGVWGIFVFETGTTSTTGVSSKHMSNTIFIGNTARNSDYYIYCKPTVGIGLQGNCRFDNNALEGLLVDTKFMCSDAMKYGATNYFDFWDGKTYDVLPNPKLTGTSATNAVVSYHGMNAFCNDKHYINLNGTWKQYIQEDDLTDITTRLATVEAKLEPAPKA